MVVKKLNAVIALLISLMLVDHTIACGIHLLTNDFSQSMPIPARALMILTGLHAVISIVVVFVRHDSKFVKYTKKNVRTIVQRDSGFLMLIALGFHVYAAKQLPEVGPLMYISHFFVVLLSMVHAGVSIPNALVTLGVLTSQKKFKFAAAVCAVLCGLLFLFGVAGSVLGGILR